MGEKPAFQFTHQKNRPAENGILQKHIHALFVKSIPPGWILHAELENCQEPFDKGTVKLFFEQKVYAVDIQDE